jgi:hypothetical protein
MEETERESARDTLDIERVGYVCGGCGLGSNRVEYLHSHVVSFLPR